MLSRAEFYTSATTIYVGQLLDYAAWHPYLRQPWVCYREAIPGHSVPFQRLSALVRFIQRSHCFHSSTQPDTEG